MMIIEEYKYKRQYLPLFFRIGKLCVYSLLISALGLVIFQNTLIHELYKQQELLAQASYYNSSAIIDLTRFILDGNRIISPPTPSELKEHTVFIEGEGRYIREIPVLGTSKEHKVSWLGTGVVVKITGDATYILTNAHVAEMKELSDQKLFVKMFNSRVSATIIAIHETQDLALIKVQTRLEGKRPIKGIAYPEIGRKVYSTGHNLGRPYLYAEGLFAGTTHEYDIYQLPIMSGCSGSGVWDDRGMLVGLLNSVSGMQSGFTITWDICHGNAVKPFYIERFLDEYLLGIE